MAKPLIDTRGITDLARDLGRIDKSLRSSLIKEVRVAGDKVRDRVRSSTAPPYGPIDSKGKIGRKRLSVKTSVRGATIALYSKEPDANVWNWGGGIAPRGVRIEFPRTEFIYGPAKDAVPEIEAAMEGILDATAARYQFHGK